MNKLFVNQLIKILLNNDDLQNVDVELIIVDNNKVQLNVYHNNNKFAIILPANSKIKIKTLLNNLLK